MAEFLLCNPFVDVNMKTKDGRLPEEMTNNETIKEIIRKRNTIA